MGKVTRVMCYVSIAAAWFALGSNTTAIVVYGFAWHRIFLYVVNIACLLVWALWLDKSSKK